MKLYKLNLIKNGVKKKYFGDFTDLHFFHVKDTVSNMTMVPNGHNLGSLLSSAQRPVFQKKTF